MFVFFVAVATAQGSTDILEVLLLEVLQLSPSAFPLLEGGVLICHAGKPNTLGPSWCPFSSLLLLLPPFVSLPLLLAILLLLGLIVLPC